MIEIVYALPEHIAAIEGPQKRTVRAIAALRDGELAGVAGYSVEGGRAVVFSKILGTLPAKTIIRAARMAIGMATETGLPVVALPDPEIPGSKRFLEHLGFTFEEAGPWHG